MQHDYTINILPSHMVLALPEMLDAIFAHLHPPLGWDTGCNRAALCACRLVNHLWGAASFQHLWLAVSFAVGPTHVDGTHSPRRSNRSLDALHEFVSSSVDIRNAVQSLRLVSGSNSPGVDISSSTLYSVFSLFPALKYIVLDAVCQRLFNAAPDHNRTLLCVRSIELRGDMRGRHGSPENFHSLTDMFADVGEIRFVDFWLSFPGKIVPRPHATRISKIDFASPHFVSELFAVLQHLDVRHLSSFSIALNHIGDGPSAQAAFAAFLDTICPHLIELGIRLSGRYDTTEGTQIHRTVLSACRNLRRVRFITFWWADSLAHTGHRASWRRLIACIAYLPDTIETVIIDFVCGAQLPSNTVLTDALPHVADLCKGFEEVIASRPPSTRVSLVPGGKPAFSLAEQARLRTLFPTLYAAGLVDL